MTKRSKRGKKLGGKVQFQGIASDAATLHVSDSYLWRCLTGRIINKDVVRSYWLLKRQQARKLLEETEEFETAAAN